MKEIEQFKEKVLKEYPRLKADSPFRFDCHHGVACFNECCGDVNIFLTPYDIIRLKNNLGISSGEFLDRYTLSPFNKDSKFPVVLLRMEDNDRKSCPFNRPEGCSVYGDRPWACRMYPVGVAQPGEGNQELEEEFYFLLKESCCRGYDEPKEWTIEEYKKNQGVEEYDRYGELFKNLTTHRYFGEGKMLSPEKMDMFFTVCYDIDSFRRFIFNSSFFDKFEVDGETRTKIKEDDVELLKFGYQWLRFALFGEKTMTIRQDVLADRQAEVGNRAGEGQAS
ncbi:YkgJ family cysteine cluster protein [candidate division GN15 bacterium]|nr:YkgJ family cysteine cluster protein [candidate division GN15 bacterium]